MAGLSPTQRTLAAMRGMGRRAGIVERHTGVRPGQPFGIRMDLFGFIDIIVIDPADGILGVQSCGQDFHGHVKKICGLTEEGTEELRDNLVAWLNFSKLELWGWRKVKLKRGGKAIRWKPRIGDFHLDPETGDVLFTERK